MKQEVIEINVDTRDSNLETILKETLKSKNNTYRWWNNF